jgi:hypothetical protein
VQFPSDAVCGLQAPPATARRRTPVLFVFRSRRTRLKLFQRLYRLKKIRRLLRLRRFFSEISSRAKRCSNSSPRMFWFAQIPKPIVPQITGISTDPADKGTIRGLYGLENIRRLLRLRRFLRVMCGCPGCSADHLDQKISAVPKSFGVKSHGTCRAVAKRRRITQISLSDVQMARVHLTKRSVDALSFLLQN